jgi:anionic cell wall polymer biosynthesis LytR-Cps2A-Psr (LCP) family protein
MVNQAKNSNIKKIMLFVSSNSYYYSTTIENFQKLVDSLGQIGAKFKVEIIDVQKDPETAEKYNILVEPTLIIGDKYFVGRFEDERVAKYMKGYFGRVIKQ